MTWVSLEETIKQNLLTGNLADPNIRLGALNTIGELIKEHFPEIYAHPIILLETKKDNFEEQISKYTNLSGAKSSIINNLYNTLIEYCSRLHTWKDSTFYDIKNGGILPPY